MVLIIRIKERQLIDTYIIIFHPQDKSLNLTHHTLNILSFQLFWLVIYCQKLLLYLSLSHVFWGHT